MDKKLHSRQVVKSSILTTGRMYRNIKCFVFQEVFKEKENLLLAYKALYPDDTEVTEDDIVFFPLRSDGFPKMENDISFLVRGRRFIFFEAQSTWSFNIPFRSLSYTVEALWSLLENTGRRADVYKVNPVELPMPEVYLIYPYAEDKPAVLSLSDIHFGNQDGPLDFKVQVLQHPENLGILGEIIFFYRIYDDKVALYGNTREGLEAIKKECISHNILRDYLLKHGEEFIKGSMKVFSYEDALEEEHKKEIQEVRRKSLAEGETKGFVKGEVSGFEKGQLETSRKMILHMKEKGLDAAAIADFTGYDAAYVARIF